MVDEQKFAFSSAIRKAHETMSYREMAKMFEVSETTIMRWANGTSYPLPRIRDYVVQTLVVNSLGNTDV